MKHFRENSSYTGITNERFKWVCRTSQQSEVKSCNSFTHHLLLYRGIIRFFKILHPNGNNKVTNELNKYHTP